MWGVRDLGTLISAIYSVMKIRITDKEKMCDLLECEYGNFLAADDVAWCNW